jgi:hypothetical protein
LAAAHPGVFFADSNAGTPAVLFDDIHFLQDATGQGEMAVRAFAAVFS